MKTMRNSFCFLHILRRKLHFMNKISNYKKTKKIFSNVYKENNFFVFVSLVRLRVKTRINIPIFNRGMFVKIYLK